MPLGTLALMRLNFAAVSFVSFDFFLFVLLRTVGRFFSEKQELWKGNKGLREHRCAISLLIDVCQLYWITLFYWLFVVCVCFTPSTKVVSNGNETGVLCHSAHLSTILRKSIVPFVWFWFVRYLILCYASVPFFCNDA